MTQELILTSSSAVSLPTTLIQPIIVIENLTLHTIIGVHAWERVMKQQLLVSARLTHNLPKAFASDDLSDAINYQQVCEDIMRIADDAKAHLLEHLTQLLLEHLFAHYPCTSIELSLKKPAAISAAQAVGLSVSCTREQFTTIANVAAINDA